MKVLVNCWFRNIDNERLSNEFIDNVMDSGADGIELSIDYPLIFRKELPEHLLRKLKDNGLILSIHLPWRELYLASPIEEVRKLAVDLTVRVINNISKYEPAYLITHLSTDQAYCGYKDKECLGSAVKSANDLLRAVEDLGLQLAIETVSDRCCSCEDKLPKILTEVSKLRACLDIPHIIEYRLRYWGVKSGVSEVVSDLAPLLLDRTSVIHVHGVKVFDNVAISHSMPSREFMDELINSLKPRLDRNSIKYSVIEVFRNYDNEPLKKLNEIRWIIRSLKRW